MCSRDGVVVVLVTMMSRLEIEFGNNDLYELIKKAGSKVSV
jgi:hypothetical protein